MIEVKTTLYCPHCFATNIVRNGHESNGNQNYLCRNCGKQFQHEYLYRGCQNEIKQLIVKTLVNGNGIREIGNILSVILGCVLRTWLRVGECIHIKPARKHYAKVQIDELYSFVGHKQKKVWILYAYCAETDEILALTAGKRSAKRVKDPLKRLEGSKSIGGVPMRGVLSSTTVTKTYHTINHRTQNSAWGLLSP